MELSAKVVQRSSTIAADGDAVPTPTDTGSPCEVRKSVPMDVGEAEATRTTLSAFKGFNRRSIRRRSSKRFERPEPTYGQDTESYDSIRQRVFQERAVTNAIDALQERWRMLMFMYNDCVDLNETRKQRKLTKLCIIRQFELTIIVVLFLLMCLPIFILVAIILR